PVKPASQRQVPPFWQTPLPLQPFPGQQESGAPPNPGLHTQSPGVSVFPVQTPGCGSMLQPGVCSAGGVGSGIVHPQSAFVTQPTVAFVSLPASNAKTVVPTVRRARNVQIRSAPGVPICLVIDDSPRLVLLRRRAPQLQVAWRHYRPIVAMPLLDNTIPHRMDFLVPQPCQQFAGERPV